MEERQRHGRVAMVWRRAEGVEEWRGYRKPNEYLSSHYRISSEDLFYMYGKCMEETRRIVQRCPHKDRKLNLLWNGAVECLWDALRLCIRPHNETYNDGTG